jgi:hypothetical protein
MKVKNHQPLAGGKAISYHEPDNREGSPSSFFTDMQQGGKIKDCKIGLIERKKKSCRC